MRLLNFNLTKFWIVALLFFIPSFSFAQSFYIELSSPNPADGPFPLRWGEREPVEDDRVPYPPGWLIDGDPACFKAGATIRLTLKQTAPHPEYGWIVEWGVGYLTLGSNVTGELLRFYPDSPDLPANQPYDFGPLVEWVEYAFLEMAVYVRYEKGISFEDFHGFVDELFIVLDEPKAPMNPAWVSLLRYSCRWARGTSNLYDAAQAITFGVFFQRPGFAYPRDTGSRWLDYTSTPPNFMLKALLDRWSSGEWTKGNCADVSCFTMLALCSVGLDFSVRQLTGSLLPSPPACGRKDCPPPWEEDEIEEHFHTNEICPIGSDPTPGDDPSEPTPPYPDYTYKWWAWAWHQVCVLTGAPDPPSNDAGIWDPTAAQKEDLNGNGYRNPPAHHPNHLWPQKDYWQKPHTQVPNAWLGLVGGPTQSAKDPQLYGRGTWKCGVSADPWIPPP